VTSRSETSSGTFHHLALLVDGEGNNSWLWLDAAIGVEQSLFGHAGWLLPGEVETSTGLVAITLERAGDGTVVPGDPQPVEDLGDQDPMPCMPEDSSFEWDWLAEGRCPMSEVDGARVVLEVW
jgi:hypothetical protein